VSRAGPYPEMWSVWVDQSSAEGKGTEGADGGKVSQKNFGMFSFEMVHFDAFWNTF